jgi:hypothetical protein
MNHFRILLVAARNLWLCKLIELLQIRISGPMKSILRVKLKFQRSFGSLLETNQGFFLIGMSLGETMTPEGVCITHCSMASPLGLALRGKEEGESVPWRKTSIQIIKLFD